VTDESRRQERPPPAVALVVLTGPIGSGKSTAAELLARRVATAGHTAALADLDDIAFMQRGRLDLGEFWRRAGAAHCVLVRIWFEHGVDVVIAHGPFFESNTYDELFATSPPGRSTLHVLLRVSYDDALARVSNDADRGPHALSKDPEFLRSTHDAFTALETTLPATDLEIDTSELAPEEIAERLAAEVLLP
jgi:shikimate kinase